MEPVLRIIEPIDESIPASVAILRVELSGMRFLTGNAALKKAEQVRALIDAVAAAGLSEEAVSLEGLTASVEKGLFSTTSSAVYRLAIRCEELDRLPAVLDAITGQKKASLTSVDWEYDEQPFRRKAMREAVRRARESAEAIASEAGRSVSELVEVREVRPGPSQLHLEDVDASLLRAHNFPPAARSAASSLAGWEFAPKRGAHLRLELTFRLG